MATHPVLRVVHDVGLAAWTGGALMGAVGLNGAVAQLDDPTQRARAATYGWTRWAPVNAAAIGGHLVGAVGLLVTDWPRVRGQRAVAASSAAKAATTGLGLGLAAWSLVLNRTMARVGPVPVQGATEPGPDTPADVVGTLRQLQLVQWAHPVVGLGLIGLSAWQSEQQRTSQVVQGTVQRLLSRGSVSARGVGAVTAAAALGLLVSRRGAAGQRQPDVAPPAAGAPTAASPDRASAPAAVPGGVASSAVPRQAADARVAEPAPGLPVGADSTASDGTTTLREQPQVGTEAVGSQPQAVRTHVVTEPVTETVIIRREEPVVKREPITDANLEAALDGPDLSEEEHEVVLHAEEPVVSRETVPAERVDIGTDAVIQQHAAGDVREEPSETRGDIGR